MFNGREMSRALERNKVLHRQQRCAFVRTMLILARASRARGAHIYWNWLPRDVQKIVLDSLYSRWKLAGKSKVQVKACAEFILDTVTAAKSTKWFKIVETGDGKGGSNFVVLGAFE